MPMGERRSMKSAAGTDTAFTGLNGRKAPELNRHLKATVGFLDYVLKGVFADVDNADLSSGVVFRIARVGRVDHDGRSEFTSNRAGRRLRGVGRAEHVSNLAHCFEPFVDNGDAFFAAGLLDGRFVAIRRAAAGHEANDVIELIVAIERPEDLAQLFALAGANLESKLFFERAFGFRRHDIS